ncbi:hypothetical protein G6F56_012474 [Rhizopus delemar]|nr:hypothetical protein G6F56_012474 [Rhizopus delemar]
MAGRFIGDNGLCTRLIMDIAQKYKIPGIGLMLDQEKAYDRVHPTYLRLCLQHFGLSQRLTDCITSLFFNTSLCVNVNGFISTPFDQGRGLRQGDPLSPLLFNLVLEPLLRTIYATSSLPGFVFHNPLIRQPSDNQASAPSLKALTQSPRLC